MQRWDFEVNVVAVRYYEHSCNEIKNFLNEKKIPQRIVESKFIHNVFSDSFNYTLSGPCANMLRPEIQSSGEINLCSFGYEKGLHLSKNVSLDIPNYPLGGCFYS